MRLKIFLLILCLLTITCVSAKKKQSLPSKYDFISNNFEMGDRVISTKQFEYIQQILTLDVWTSHQFGLTFQKDSVVKIWWTDDPEDEEGTEIKGAWNLKGNIITLNGVGRFSGKYIIQKYKLEYSVEFKRHFFTIFLDKQIGAPGYEGNNLFIELR